MSPMETQMQVQKALVWATLLIGAMVFGFFMASETLLLILAVFALVWMATLPNHARLSAMLGMATGGSALILPMMPGRPFVWEVAGMLGWTGVFVSLIMKRQAPGFEDRVRRHRWMVFFILAYVLVLLYLMRTHGFGLRVFGGDRIGGRQYLQQIACLAFPLVFLVVRFKESELVKWFVIHLLLSLTFVLSDLALASGSGGMWVFYFLDLAVDSVQFEFGSEATGIKRFQSFALVSMALLQGLILMVPMRRGFSLSGIWVIPAIMGAIGAGLPGGHRAVLLLEVGFVFACGWAQQVLTPLRLVVSSWVLALLLIAAYAMGPQLPLAAQRALTVLPGIELDAIALADARKTYEGRVIMREVGIQLIPNYLWRGRGFGKTSEAAPMLLAQDPYGTIAEHVEYGRFYNGPVGLMVNTGIPGTLCVMGLLVSGSWVAIRALLHVRRRGVNDMLEGMACSNAAYWLMKVGVFLFLHGDSEYAMNTFGLHLGMLVAVDRALMAREQRERMGWAIEPEAPAALPEPKPEPWWRRRPGGARPAPVA